MNYMDRIETPLDLVEAIRSSYLEHGIAICPGFLTAEAVAGSVREVAASKGKEWLTNSTHNVFLDQGDPVFPEDHVRSHNATKYPR